MCKLNILCQEIDGKCSCYGPSSKIIEKYQPMNGILSSILEYIKTQPEIMNSLRGDTSHHIDDPDMSPSELSESIESASTPTRAGSQDDRGDYSIKLLSEPLKNIFTDKTYSLLFQISDSKFNPVKFESPITVIISILEKFDSKEKIKISETTSTGNIFFRQVAVHEAMKNAILIVKTERENGILPYIQHISIKNKKKPQKSRKITKIEAI